MNTEIHEQLQALALKRSLAFCYNCYTKAPSGRCETCFSDDLMRITESGCEYGNDWIIEEILEAELTPVNVEESFEQMVRDCWPETTKVAWADFDTIDLLKSQDPVSWRCALSEHESNEAEEGFIISFDNGSTYYRRDDIDDLLQRES